MRRNNRISVANVNEDSVCCAVASLLNFGLFNLIQQACSESLFPEESALHELLE